MLSAIMPINMHPEAASSYYVPLVRGSDQHVGGAAPAVAQDAAQQKTLNMP